MKYNQTHRLINTVLFGILAAGFITLVVFFTFFWAPNTIDQGYASSIDWIKTDKPFAFFALLGTAFFALALVAIQGFIFSIKSLQKPTDDKLVVNSFLCYVAMGYVVTLFFFVNAIWLYDLIGGSQFVFWIVLSVILAIIALIAANVPMMKLIEDEDSKSFGIILSGTLFVSGLGAFVNTVFPLIVAILSGKSVKFALYHLSFYAGITFVVAALAGIACLVLKKKNGSAKVGNILTYASWTTLGLMPLVSAIIELVYEYSVKKDTWVSLMNPLKSSYAYAGDAFVVTSFVTAGLIIFSGIVLIIVALVDKKEAK